MSRALRCRAGAVDLRITNCVSREYSAPLCRFNFDIFSRAWKEILPNCSRGTLIVVKGGRARKAKEMSSIPKIDMSPGTSTPAASKAINAPIAMRSLPQKITVGVSGAERITSTADAPASKLELL